jgi:3-hydroxyisobutyrate dehydrogenase-like beta-hydroxyacid dehydrogenase
MQAAEVNSIGLVGIGLLGRAIASRLLTAGFSVLGFDVDASKRQTFGTSGGQPVETLLEVAQQCATVVVAVFDTDQVEQVVERDPAFAAGIVRTVICMSTCDPDRIAALAVRIDLLEVPISGTSAQVAQGVGVALVAGDAVVAEAASRVIAVICPRSHYLGAAGSGGRAKLVVNLILGLNRAAVAEGLAFAERLGLDRARLLEVAKGSAAYSQVMDVKGALWAEDRFQPPLSRVDQSFKDFSLICELGRRAGQPLPFASLYAGLMQDCIDHGEAAQDNAILINAIRRRRDP